MEPDADTGPFDSGEGGHQVPSGYPAKHPRLTIHQITRAGIPPTGRAVRVPYSVVYDLRGDRISALRIYFPMSQLIEQLTA